jgi:hypothetical protein
MSANFYNGSELLEYCEYYLNETNASLANACYGYVAGHHDTEKFLSFEAINYYCVPQGTGSKELIEVAVKYLKDHPRDLHYAASSLLFIAFTQAYPCQ